jgi:hypothetical protein
MSALEQGKVLLMQGLKALILNVLVIFYSESQTVNAESSVGFLSLNWCCINSLTCAN